jgi:dipeptidyl aminopeptidase/acylaminoacyl peptidase
MVMVGEKDKTVGFNNGKYFYNCLLENGKKCHYLTYKNDWH